METEKQNIIFTFIMPTLNSERTIAKALYSIRWQSFPQDKIEILVIDGGSVDNTINIAKMYNAIVLKNVLRKPESAKVIGIQNAKGRWIVLHDSDEVFVSKNQLMKRYKFLQANPNIYCYTANKLIPGKKCGISSAYLNIVSNPFGYIVYKNRGSIVKNNEKYLSYKNLGNVYKYTINDIVPVGDGGTSTFNILKAKELFGNKIYSQEFAVSAFFQLVNKTSFVGCIPEDNILHFSSATFRGYLKKLHFLIFTNLNNIEEAGYRSKSKYNKKLKYRKVWFLFYCFTLVGPIFDSFKLALINKRPSLILHFVYTYYVLFVTFFEIMKKILKLKKGNYLYGK